MMQQSHSWVYIQKNWNQDLQEISALPCSLLNYPQYSRHANNPNTHDRWVDKGNVAVTEHRVELPVLHSNFPLAIYFTYICGMQGWEGGSSGRGHMYTYGWFTLLNGRNQHNIVKQLSSN